MGPDTSALETIVPRILDHFAAKNAPRETALTALPVQASPTNKTLAIAGLNAEYTASKLEKLIQNRVLTVEKREGYRIVKGITTVEDARERLAAGATLLQAYTAFIYGGPLWPARLNRALAQEA